MTAISRQLVVPVSRAASVVLRICRHTCQQSTATLHGLRNAEHVAREEVEQADEYGFWYRKNPLCVMSPGPYVFTEMSDGAIPAAVSLRASS
eukprot:CAMPEP_0119204378 /NCGR_PEP_ID=MMETSP1316-20130426/37193_1 /TAXON_ID=41880 /ORGANISM="Pycnococcus provasolii, Strain RCC2336" /LENGTH=91 /DNA_ID=CAMNT_0007200691 /DNA_START=106 /DNA_END=382 /DNA_ORIENTATION=+